MERIKILIKDNIFKLKGIFQKITDITQRQPAMRGLEQSEQQLRRVMTHMPVAMVAFNDNFDFIVWNRECERITGYTHSDIVANPHAFAILYPDPGYRRQVLDRLKSDTDFRDVEFTLVCKDGRHKIIRWFSIASSYPMPGWKSWAIGIDVTEKKRLGQQLREKSIAAEKAYQAKSDFLANMSHEIRTPISALIGLSQMLQEQSNGILNPRQMECVNNILESSNRLLYLVTGILDFSKIEAGKMEIHTNPFDLKKLMAQITQSMKGMIEDKNINLNVTPAPDIPPKLIADEYRIEQVLRNLLNNAVKFTEKGLITVSVEMPENELLLFKVTDTGVGIPKDKQARLFEKFYQVDATYSKKYAGTGLGLAISKELVELMGGTIGCESEPGKGSTFYFSIVFKAVQEIRKSTPEPVSGNQDVSDHSLNILLAEDDEMNAKVMTYFLKRKGHATTIAHDGRQAMDALEQAHFDIILMDIQMPGMSGIELTRRIRNSASRPDIPIIALTAYTKKWDRDKFIEAGMDDYISKPVDTDTLLKKIYQQLNTNNH
ncbi:PAS domain-containing hybrid sensor histidine kinase/response regulator [Desulfobacter latus]|uniref:histidine kinase n=1 Tax=Desulfobacter latus TaxID=2292 RepID=A0A850SUV4_9BACT|nr:ATP-binding protein [Desulfobacter latus]NWH05144.1 response regulator [Desulfobacter latus]